MEKYNFPHANTLACRERKKHEPRRASVLRRCDSVGGQNLQKIGFDQPRILSIPIGQELAPWFSDQVAVASSGLSPQPLWISAAVQQQIEYTKPLFRVKRKSG